MIALKVLHDVEKDLAEKVTQILIRRGWDAGHQGSYPVCDVFVRAEEPVIQSLQKILEQHIVRDEKGVRLINEYSLQYEIPRKPADLKPVFTPVQEEKPTTGFVLRDGNQEVKVSNKSRLLACFTVEYMVKPPEQAWLNNLASSLHDVLDELGIKCTVDSNDFQWGPRIVRANIVLSRGRKIREVAAVSSDIANKMFARQDLFKFNSDDEVPKNVRVESVPAKAMVGIYIPRNDFVAVPIGGLLRALPEGNPRSFVLGLNTIGQPQYSNLNSMPHLLVSGQPGAGKSVFLNGMIVSLALQNEPNRLRFVLIDPKGGLEFGPYQKLPHVAQIATSPEEALEALVSARKEMDERYDKMAQVNREGKLVRDIDEYNSIPNVSLLPYQVILVDEFADLVLSNHRKQIIELVQAIAQKGRAAGIYMVICTQQPRVNVIPGGIKAVIPSRLSFRLPAGVDSKVILDESGAEDLLRGGDMFLKEPTHAGLRRFQGPMVTNKEIIEFVEVAKQIWNTSV